MRIPTARCDDAASHPDSSRPALAWVVPGPLRQLTGGYLYDARIVDGLRARGWQIGVVDIRSDRWPLDLPAGRRLAGALERQRWNAVVVDELAHPAVAAAMLTRRLGGALDGAPLVLIVHHLCCSEPAPRRTRLVASLVEQLVLRAADLVVCTSATTAQTVRRLALPRTLVEIVRPGWDTHVVGFRRPPTAVERGADGLSSPLHRNREGHGGARGWGLSGEGVGGWDSPGQGVRAGCCGPRGAPGLRVLLVGHWTPRKRILDALHALRLTTDPVTLDLVGETDRDRAYAARVRQALAAPGIHGRVRVHGRVSSERLGELYRAADVLLLCSSHEGYGMVLAEGLAAGLPIVATRVGAVPEIVRDGYEASLVQPGDVVGLARALERIARDPAERQRRTELARERATILPTWHESVGAFDRLLRRLLRSPR